MPYSLEVAEQMLAKALLAEQEALDRQKYRIETNTGTEIEVERADLNKIIKVRKEWEVVVQRLSNGRGGGIISERLAPNG